MERTIPYYSAKGLAGCVQQRKCRATGVLVGVYRCDQAGLDDNAPWATICEEHSTILSTTSLGAARSFASDSCSWCDACRAAKQREVA
jgi:hypothetical protein